jgi:hypothetical protein
MIAVVGGTGDFGRGLVARWVLAGEEVIIGSRRREKAERVASELGRQLGKPVRGTTNLGAAREAEVIVLSIPFEGFGKIMDEIKPALTPQKLLLSVIVPVRVEGGVVSFERPPAGSAAEEVAKLVPRGVRVLSAFHTVGARQLQQVERPLNCDVLVCGDDAEAKREVMQLVERMPKARAIDGGPLHNSRLTEPVAALLAELTRRHRVQGVGIRLKGL